MRTFSVTRASPTLAHYSWLTQEKPDMMLGAARCYNTQSLTGHIPSRPSSYWSLRHGRAFLVIFPAFSVGNPEILLIPL
jgi:hypothetical protein